MLRKLLKYDFRSVSRMLVPALLLATAGTLLGTGALRLIIYIVTTRETGGFVATAAVVGLSLVVIASVFAIIVYSVVSTIFIYARFYKHFFTDEGYLTFTLPVKTHSLLLSKLITYTAWGAISALSIIVLIAVFIFFGCALPGEIVNMEVLKGVSVFFKEILSMTPLASIVFIIEIIVQTIASGLMVFLAIAIGCTVANKHKIVTSVAFYFVLNTALQVISTVFIMIIGLFQAENIIFFSATLVSTDVAGATSAYISLLMGFSAFFYAVVAAVEFFAINYIMKKKLNLA